MERSSEVHELITEVQPVAQRKLQGWQQSWLEHLGESEEIVAAEQAEAAAKQRRLMQGRCLPSRQT